MAHPAGCIFEARQTATASMVNGGGFNYLNANFVTDYAATVATGNSPVLTSATYTFVAGDANHWVYVQSGANWTPGFYQIASVAAGAATLSAAVGAAVQLVNGKWTASTVAGCATVASPTAGVVGIDYSQADAYVLNVTTATSAGAGNAITHASFGVNHVGNVLYCSAGTNFTSGTTNGRFHIDSCAGTTLTCSTNRSATAITTGIGSVGNITIGGAWDMTSAAVTLAVKTLEPGNILFVRAGAYTGVNNNGNWSMTNAGSTTQLIRVTGYGTVRGDEPQGSNRPSWTQTAGGMSSTGLYWEWRNLIFQTSTNGNGFVLGQSTFVGNMKLINVNTGASVVAAITTSAQYWYKCEFVCYRGTGLSMASTSLAIYCVFRSCKIGALKTASTLASNLNNCLFYANSVNHFTLSGASDTQGTNLVGCTFYSPSNTYSTGITFITTTTSPRVINCVFNNLLLAVSAADNPNNGLDLNNNYYGNGGANTNWPAGYGSVAVDPAFPVTVVTGTNATISGSTLTSSGKDFTALGVTTNDSVYISAGTAGPVLTNYGITAVGTTTITLDVAPGDSAVADHTYWISVGRNFTPGANIRGLGAPGLLPGTLTTSYADIGAAQSDGSATDPGIANVRSGTNYTFSGAKTGTLSVPTAANVLSGVAVDAGTGTYVTVATASVKTGVTYGAASALTGTYDGSDRWTDPTEALVISATAYKANSLTNNKTGTYVGPATADVRLSTAYGAASALTGTLDLPAIADVKLGVIYDNTTKTGTYALAASVLDEVLETGFTVKEALRLMLSALAGKVSGGGTTTVTIRDVNDTKNRIVATVDTNGNRSAVTKDVT